MKINKNENATHKCNRVSESNKLEDDYQYCSLDYGVARVSEACESIINGGEHDINEILINPDPISPSPLHMLINPPFSHRAQLLCNPPHRLNMPLQIQPPQRRERDRIRHHELPRHVHKLFDNIPERQSTLIIPPAISLPADHHRDRVQRQLLEPITDHHHLLVARLGGELVQLPETRRDLGLTHELQGVEPAGGEHLDEHQLPYLAPVGAVGEAEAGVVVAEVDPRGGAWPFGQDSVVCCEAVLDCFATGDHYGSVYTQPEGENGPEFIGHGA